MNGNVKDGPPPASEGDEKVELMTLTDSALALTAVDRAAIDSQVATAKQYPRTVSKALKEALSIATLDEETAASMFYALPRSGKTIEGPSARLAEVMAYAWSNLRIDADIVAEDKTTVTAMGTCFDLEKNVAVRVRVKRRITDKHGKRFNEDMIGVTSNAAISIALRNSVFKVIPRAMVDRIYLAARKASLGEASTLTQKRQKAVDWFVKAGVTAEQVYEQLGVRDMDDIDEEAYIALRGLYNAIKEGETSVESIFGRNDKSERTTELNEALATTEKPTGTAPPAPEAKGGEGLKSRVAAAKAASTPQQGAQKCSVCLEVLPNHRADCPNRPAAQQAADDLKDDQELLKSEDAPRNRR